MTTSPMSELFRQAVANPPTHLLSALDDLKPALSDLNKHCATKDAIDEEGEMSKSWRRRPRVLSAAIEGNEMHATKTTAKRPESWLDP